MPANRDGAAPRPTQMIDVIGRGARGLGMNLEEDASALAGRVGNPGEAFLDQRPARRAGREFRADCDSVRMNVLQRGADMPDARPAINRA